MRSQFSRLGTLRELPAEEKSRFEAAAAIRWRNLVTAGVAIQHGESGEGGKAFSVSLYRKEIHTGHVHVTCN